MEQVEYEPRESVDAELILLPALALAEMIATIESES